MDKFELNIVFLSDKNYFKYTYITLLSLLETKNFYSKYNVKILSSDLLEKEKLNLLENLNSFNFTVENIPITLENPKSCNSFYNSIIFTKLNLHKIFPLYSKLLLLDSDIIIKNDLTELYNTDIYDYYLAGVKDIGPIIYHKINNNKIYSNYFNVGVLLLNLNKIREDELFERALDDYEKNCSKYFFPEQDALNNVIDETKIKLLHPKFNWITSTNRYTNSQICKIWNLNSIKEVNPNNIVILHYAGGCRPWIYKNAFFAKDWLKYYNNSYFKNELSKIKWIPFFKFFIFLKNQWEIFRNKKLYKELGIVD